MRELSQFSLGYIAAMIDGEGSICLSRTRRENSYLYDYHPAVQVSNTSELLLGQLVKMSQIGKVRPQYGESSKRSAAWKWVWSCDEIRAFMPIIGPVLVLKRRQAELLLEFFGTLGRHNETVSEEAWILRACIFDELAILNKRGPKNAVPC